MIVIPALDLRAGKCVQLVGGSYDKEKIRLDDPVSVAQQWAKAGFKRLHVVDLDAATDIGSNESLIDKIIRATKAEVQVGGGIRKVQHASRLLSSGARRVIAGTRALEEPAWISELATLHPDRVIVAVDIRDGEVVKRGWQATHSGSVNNVVAAMNALPLAGLLVTAVHTEGLMQGTDTVLFEKIMRQTHLEVIASGGVGSMDDLRALASIGVSGVVVGMALYAGKLDPAEILTEFPS